ncbi:MAG: alpha/beta fold hydrolase, partial [Janthinobacterium lividum]
MTQPGTSTIRLAPDLEVTVREAGDGPPLLLLHGGAGPSSIPTAYTRLARTHRVLAPVHPGWANTPRPSRLDDVAAL